MKQITLLLITTVSLFACTPKQNETSSNADDAAMADFKENSKIILAVLRHLLKTTPLLSKTICQIQLK